MAMSCTYYNATTQSKQKTSVTWKIFYPACPKINPYKICNSLGGAYVPAITICTQRLF